jgi:hypothetical protein
MNRGDKENQVAVKFAVITSTFMGCVMLAEIIERTLKGRIR